MQVKRICVIASVIVGPLFIACLIGQPLAWWPAVAVSLLAIATCFGWRVVLASLATSIVVLIAVVIYKSQPITTRIDTQLGSATFTYKIVAGSLTEDSSDQILTIDNRDFPSVPARSITTKIVKRHYWSGVKVYVTEDGRYLELKVGERPGEFYRYDLATHQIDTVDRSAIAEPRDDSGSLRRDWTEIPSKIRPGRKFIGRFCYQDFLLVEKYGEPDIDDRVCEKAATLDMRRSIKSSN